MGIAVVTVASGGLPVIDVTATTPRLGLAVTEAANGRGIAVTKVSLPAGGVPVTYVAATLQLTESFRALPSDTERYGKDDDDDGRTGRSGTRKMAG